VHVHLSCPAQIMASQRPAHSQPSPQQVEPLARPDRGETMVSPIIDQRRSRPAQPMEILIHVHTSTWPNQPMASPANGDPSPWPSQPMVSPAHGNQRLRPAQTKASPDHRNTRPARGQTIPWPGQHKSSQPEP
jgi:hypothetical protein